MLSHGFYDVLSFAVVVLIAFVVIILLRYLIAEWWVGNLVVSRYIFCNGLKRHQMGVAFTALLCGVLLREMHFSGAWPNMVWLYGGTALLGTGALCLVRVLVPEDWGHHAWLICAAITGLLTMIYAVI